MAKKVSFSKPTRPKEANLDVDKWVATGSPEATEKKPAKNRKPRVEEVVQVESGETTRFTIDIPIELHAQIKAKCALKKVKMKEEIQLLLENHFA